MRRYAFSALAALLLVLSAAVPPANANGVAQNTNLRLAMRDFPTQVLAGKTIRGDLELTNLTAEYQSVNVQYALVTPLGNAVIRTSSRNVAPSSTKQLRSTFTVDQDARPGDYTLVVSATANNTTVNVTHTFTIVRR